MNDDIKDDPETVYMNEEWLEYGIVILILAISTAAFAFFIGYLL
jgi:hypothetical protein